MKHAEVMRGESLCTGSSMSMGPFQLQLPIATLKATSLKMNISTSGIMCRSVKASFLKPTAVLKDPDFWNYTEKCLRVTTRILLNKKLLSGLKHSQVVSDCNGCV